MEIRQGLSRGQCYAAVFGDNRRLKQKGPNLPASVIQRLRNRAQQTGEDLQYVLIRYGAERLLYRLSQSEYAGEFVVKGAMLFLVWADEPYRATKDLDLLGRQRHSATDLVVVFQKICRAMVVDDGLSFLPETVEVGEIREDTAYGGLRTKLVAQLGKVRIPIQVDIGFGDVVTPPARKVAFPVLLDFPAPHVAIYPRETTVAEKLETMVNRGTLNSRMRDYYDLWVISQEFEFDGDTLRAAIQATFKRRKTALPPEVPSGLTAEFAADAAKQTQWRAFVNKSQLKFQEGDLGKVIEALHRFLMPTALAARQSTPFAKVWPKGGPWQPKPKTV